jgi:hypothetical protein
MGPSTTNMLTANSLIQLLTKFLKIYLSATMLSRMPILKERSAREIQELIHFQSPPQYITSRLLDLQIKCILLKVMRPLAVHALEDLERCVRTRIKTSWPDSFSAILSLCLFIEELQIIAVAGSTIQSTAEQQPPSKDAIFNTCRELEQSPFQIVTDIFHGIYRTSKENDGVGKGDKGFNPLGQSLTGAKQSSQNFGLDKPAGDMIRDFGQMISNSCEY